MMNRFAILFFVVLIAGRSFAQKQVVFTIDDVPNTRLYNAEGFRCRLLEKIDSMNLPVAIFINEQRLFYTDSFSVNLQLFNNWFKSKNVTIGNHAFSHAMYSEVGIDSFKTEILKGDAISKELANKQHKEEKYFRFPYNDLGKDEQQHKEAATFLKDHHYIITPFTVHSEDWLITSLYAYYKTHNMAADAARIGHASVTKTLEYFDYIESLTDKKENRNVKQIYLMHDNLLNADYLPELVDSLKKKGYAFITLDQAMTDSIYQQTDYFMEQPGISWVYRWVKDKQLRETLIKNGPNTTEFEEELKRIKNK